VKLGSVLATFHHPRPERVAAKGAVKSVRVFLENEGGKSMSVLTYKDYHGHFERDRDADIFHGQVMNLSDVIAFQGRSIDELKQALADSVEDYP
jgi:hypothetical protein